MLIALLVQLTVAHAAPADLRITFTNSGVPCEIELAARRVPESASFRRYDVRKLVVPGLPPAGLIKSTMLWLVPEARGDAMELALDLFHECIADLAPLFDEFLDETSTDPVVLSARTGVSPEDLAVTRAARAFARGEQPGRAVHIQAFTSARDGAPFVAQTLFLLIPDATYPRGVLASNAGQLPTWDALVTLHWPDPSPRAAIVHPVHVHEDPAQRGPSYRVVPRPPPADLPDLPRTSEILTF